MLINSAELYLYNYENKIFLKVLLTKTFIILFGISRDWLHS
jgi:hypothetical protein